MAKGYVPSGLGLAEPGANRASSPKAGSRYAKSINPNKSSGQLDSVLGQGPDASYSTFIKSGGPKAAASNNSGGSNNSGSSNQNSSANAGTQQRNTGATPPKASAPANSAPKGLLGKISTYGKALITSPVSTVKDIATGQQIDAVDNGALILKRAPLAVTSKIKQQQSKNLPAGTPGQLDHIVPLEAGGTNSPSNLKLIPKAADQANNNVENFLGAQLKANVINAQQAKQLALDYKSGKITDQQLYQKASPGGSPKGQSLLSKASNVVKTVAKAATTGEQKFATGIARDLPGGTADLQANAKAADQASKNIQFTIAQVKAGKMKPADAQKVIQSNAQLAGMNAKDTADIIKKMPTKAQIALGAASTAADIITAGTLPELKSGSLLAKTGNAATKAGAYGTAGALNSAAGGGTKKQVAENFVAGAALPGILHVAGKGVNAVADKVAGGQATKDLVTNTKTQSLLGKVQKEVPTINAAVNPDHVVAGMVHPDIQTMPISKINIAADAVSKPDAAKINQYVKQIKDGEPIEPVVVQHVSGQTFIVDGQKRLAAAQKLGITDIPTVEKAPGPVAVPAASATPAAAAEAKTPTAVNEPVAAPAPVAAAPPAEGSIASTTEASPVTPAPIDTAPIKEQIKGIKENEKSYDKTGNLTPDAAKQITTLNKQLNAAGERVSKAEKPVTVTPIESTPHVTAPDIRTSKLAQGVETNAIKKGLTQGFEGKAEYAGVKVDEQAKAAADLIKNDPGRAVRIAMGHEQPPNGLLPESVFIGVERQATKAGDHEMLQRLATESHLTSEASGMGQRIRMLGERDTHSPVAAIKQIAEARKTAFKASNKNTTIASATSKEVQAIRAAKPAVTKETFSSFVESLKC